MNSRHRMTTMALVAALGAVAMIPGAGDLPRIEPPERTKRPEKIVNEYKSAAQAKRERKAAKRSRNGAKP